MKAIAKSRKMLVAEFLRRSENSSDLSGHNNQIKGRETFSLPETSTGSSALNSATLFCHLEHSAGGDHPTSS